MAARPHVCSGALELSLFQAGNFTYVYLNSYTPWCCLKQKHSFTTFEATVCVYLMEPECSYLHPLVDQSHQSDYTYKEEDVPVLAEALADKRHKWEEIALALRLPEAVRAECREGNSLTIKLHNVLHKWVEGQYPNAVLATRDNLKTALVTLVPGLDFVHSPDLATNRDLEENISTSLSSDTLTSSQLKSIKQVLVDSYSQCSEVPKGSWPPVGCKKFINLGLVETSSQPLNSDFSIRGDADDVLAKKTKVEYKEVFKLYKKKEKLLIVGRPGSGKTTLVHKLIRDWSAGKALHGAELVFLVSLRMLNSSSSFELSENLQSYCSSKYKRGLAQILQKMFHNEEQLKQVIDALEKVNGRGVTFILDGFDEFSYSNQEESIVFALVNKSYFADAMIIVTSRPAATSSLRDIFDESYKTIEVFGFSKSQISDYISNYPFLSSSADISHPENLQGFLSSHPGVLDLCYLPVNCAIICFIYNFKPDNLPDTQTRIYELFTNSIILRQLLGKHKYKQLPSLEHLEGQEKEDFKKLCSLAFIMTTNSQQVKTTGLEQNDEVHSLGLVTIDVTAGLSGYLNSYSFLHLTLQEFLAAYHLSKLNDEEQMSLIQKYGGAIHMRTTWKFYFGLVSFEVGLDRAKELFARVSDEIFQIQCSYEAKQSCVCQLCPLRSLLLTDTLSNYDISAVAYTISDFATHGSTMNPLKDIIFSSWGPGNDKLELLLNQISDRALNYIEKLSVSLADVSITDLEALADKLKLNRMRHTEMQGLKSLKHLKLQDVQMSDEGVAELCAGLNGNHNLEYLDLTRNSFSPIGLCKLMQIDWHLQQLDLSRNNIGDEGAIAVARGLKGNLTLKSIDLSYNKIHNAGVEALSLVLQGNAINLDLSSNDYYSPVSESLFTSLPDADVLPDPARNIETASSGTTPYCNLHTLNLSHNCYDGDPLAIISKIKSIFCLNLSENEFGISKAMSIVDYVAHSNNCRELKLLELKNITSPGLGNMHGDFSEHDILSKGLIVNLSHNNIDKKTAVSLLTTIQNYDRVRGVLLKSDRIGDKNYNIPGYKNIDLSRVVVSIDGSCPNFYYKHIHRETRCSIL